MAAAMIARAFRRMALPLAAYYAVTLALPLANGAAQSVGFWRHALIVLVVPPLAICLGALLLAFMPAGPCWSRSPDWDTPRKP